MPTGVSVLGPQDLGSRAAGEARVFAIAIDPFEDIPPSRVGFGYLMLVGGGGPSGAYVLDTFVLYRPAVYRLVPFLEFGGGSEIVLRVDWNIAGLGWESSIG